MNRSKMFNPTPISKLLATLLLSFSVISHLNELSNSMTVVFVAGFFALNDRAKTAIKTLLFYGVLIFLIHNLPRLHIPLVNNYGLTILIVVKIFFLPVMAGKFLVATSPVSSLLYSFEKMRFPKSLVIPLAVMFRYIPAFKEDRKNIKMAMKMRGISFINPVKYLEYVSVPLLISAINISDDISKAAETKCIADPGKKNRYVEVNFSWIDMVFLAGIIGMNIYGRLYA